MILTEKAQEDFEKWLKNNYELLIEDVGGFNYFWDAQTKVSEYALIIEWLDSVGLYIEIKNKFGQKKQKQRFSFVVRQYNSGVIFDSRKEATTEAIKIANNFYNGR